MQTHETCGLVFSLLAHVSIFKIMMILLIWKPLSFEKFFFFFLFAHIFIFSAFPVATLLVSSEVKKTVTALGALPRSLSTFDVR